MNIIRRFLLFTNLWVSFIGFVLSIYYQILISNKYDINSAILCFLLTFIFYNFHRIQKQLRNKLLQKDFECWLNKNKAYLLLIFLPMLFLGVHIIHDLSHQQQFLLFISVLISLGYSFKLRETSIVKPLLITFVWVVLVLVLPMELSHLNGTFFLVLASGFFSFLSIAIISDIKDMAIDEKSLPKTLGVRKTKALFLGLYFLSVLLLCCSLSLPMFIGLLIINFMFLPLLKRMDITVSTFEADAILLINPLSYWGMSAIS